MSKWIEATCATMIWCWLWLLWKGKTFLYGLTMWSCIILAGCLGCEYTEIIQPEVLIIDQAALADSIPAPNARWGFVWIYMTKGGVTANHTVRCFKSDSLSNVSCFFFLPPGDWGPWTEARNGFKTKYRTPQRDTIIDIPDYPRAFPPIYFELCLEQQNGNWTEVE